MKLTRGLNKRRKAPLIYTSMLYIAQVAVLHRVHIYIEPLQINVSHAFTYCKDWVVNLLFLSHAYRAAISFHWFRVFTESQPVYWKLEDHIKWDELRFFVWWFYGLYEIFLRTMFNRKFCWIFCSKFDFIWRQNKIPLQPFDIPVKRKVRRQILIYWWSIPKYRLLKLFSTSAIHYFLLAVFYICYSSLSIHVSAGKGIYFSSCFFLH